MGQVTIRTSQTSQGALTFAPYNGEANPYAISAINLGNNFIAKLEIVSFLNCFNLARWQYHYYYGNSAEKYNPKVYLGTIQSASYKWNFDTQTGQKNGLPAPEKSGSWPL